MACKAGEDPARSGGEEDVPLALGDGGGERGSLPRAMVQCTIP
jgi:hypothetical protein